MMLARFGYPASEGGPVIEGRVGESSPAAHVSHFLFVGSRSLIRTLRDASTILCIRVLCKRSNLRIRQVAVQCVS
jgi:hypothetical protein